MDKWTKVSALIMTILGIGGVIFGIFTATYDFGKVMEKNETRMFRDAEEKLEVVKHVEYAPTPEQLQRDRILDSINKVTAIKFRAEQMKRDRYRDSIALLNADQLYQIKEELKALKQQ